MRWGEREKRDLLIYDMMHESNFLALNSRSSGAFSSKEFRVIRWGSSRHDHVSQIIPPWFYLCLFCLFVSGAITDLEADGC